MHHSVTTLKTSELYTLSKSIVWYVNSIQYVKKAVIGENKKEKGKNDHYTNTLHLLKMYWPDTVNKPYYMNYFEFFHILNIDHCMWGWVS